MAPVSGETKALHLKEGGCRGFPFHPDGIKARVLTAFLCVTSAAPDVDTGVPVPFTEVQKMTDVLGICLAVGVFHIHHLLKKQAVPCGSCLQESSL